MSSETLRKRNLIGQEKFHQTKKDSDSTAADLSKSQDSAASDDTTTVVVIAGAFLRQCLSVIFDSLHKAALKAVNVLTATAVPVELSNRESLIKSASTSLNSKVVSQYSSLLAPLAVDSVLSVVDPLNPISSISEISRL